LNILDIINSICMSSAPPPRPVYTPPPPPPPPPEPEPENTPAAVQKRERNASQRKRGRSSLIANTGGASGLGDDNDGSVKKTLGG